MNSKETGHDRTVTKVLANVLGGRVSDSRR